MTSLTKVTLLAAALGALPAAIIAEDRSPLPLRELPGSESRDHWLPAEVTPESAVAEMQKIVAAKGVPFAGTQDRPIQIALIYPSADVSDFWARNFIALTKRLDELGIAYETTEFASRQIEHSLQSTYANQVVQDQDIYDFVIFGPSELAIQADNIEKMAASEGFATFVWAFHTPLKDLKHQPDAWLDFSSAAGAQTMCRFVLERLGKDVTMALNRGIPGVTDNQRSGDFRACVEEQGNWTTIYEHYGEYQRQGGFDGTSLILQSFPEATVIHNANTAMAMGSVEAQVAFGREKEIFSTGWGGTGLELDAIRRGELNATPMRMGDDVGAATAEAIKAHMEDRPAAFPFVFLGRIVVAHDGLSAEELDAMEQEAFRFSGVGALER